MGCGASSSSAGETAQAAPPASSSLSGSARARGATGGTVTFAAGAEAAERKSGGGEEHRPKAKSVTAEMHARRSQSNSDKRSDGENSSGKKLNKTSSGGAGGEGGEGGGGGKGSGHVKRNSNLQEQLVSLNNANTNVRDVYEGVDQEDNILGSGNWGVVKVVTRKRDSKRFACKIIKLDDQMSDVQFEELRQEIAALRQLDHVAIAKLFETFEEPGHRLYLIMELLTGGELYTSLVERSPTGRFDELRTRRLVRRMVSSIAYLHDRGLVHRDIKLENFCFRGDETEDEIVLIDFGLAKLYEMRQGAMTEVVGSSYYIAPEVVEGSYSGPGCDMWSLGVIVFMALSGRPPFDGGTDQAIMRKAVKGKYSMADDVFRTEVSTIAQDFVRKCLVKDPQQRMTSRDALRHQWLTCSDEQLIDAGAGDDPTRAMAPGTIPETLSMKGAAEIVRRSSRRISASLFGEGGASEGALDRLRMFATRHELVRLFAQAVAFALGRDELKDLVKLFVKLDRDSDGFIVSSDIEVGLLGAKPEEAEDASPRAVTGREKRGGNLMISFRTDDATTQRRKRRREANYLFSAIDVTKRGRASLNEFLAATLDVGVFFKDVKVMEDAFARINGGVGHIDLRCLQTMMDSRFNERRARRDIQEFVGAARFGAEEDEPTTAPGEKKDSADENKRKSLSKRVSEKRKSGYGFEDTIASPRRVDVDRIVFEDFLKGMWYG